MNETVQSNALTATATLLNPYRDGSAYHRVFQTAVRLCNETKGKGFLRSSLLNALKTMKDKDGIVLSPEALNSTVSIILSPRMENEGDKDCRGNISAQGHLYYIMENEVAVMQFGKAVMKDDGVTPETDTRYTVHMRETALPKLARTSIKNDPEIIAAKLALKVAKDNFKARISAENAELKAAKKAKKAEKKAIAAKAKADKKADKAKVKAEKLEAKVKLTADKALAKADKKAKKETAKAKLIADKAAAKAAKKAPSTPVETVAKVEAPAETETPAETVVSTETAETVVS